MSQIACRRDQGGRQTSGPWFESGPTSPTDVEAFLAEFRGNCQLLLAGALVSLAVHSGRHTQKS